MRVTGAVVTPIRISCATDREPNAEKQTIDASAMAPVPQLVPRVGACTRSKKVPNRRVPMAPISVSPAPPSARSHLALKSVARMTSR